MLSLTVDTYGRSVVNEASKPQYTSVYPARQPGFIAPALWREGGEYNTIWPGDGAYSFISAYGNKPAYLVLGFEPPATSGSSKALWCRLLNSQHKGLQMTKRTLQDKPALHLKVSFNSNGLNCRMFKHGGAVIRTDNPDFFKFLWLISGMNQIELIQTHEIVEADLKRREVQQ